MPLDYFLDRKIYLNEKGYSDTDINRWQMWKFSLMIKKINDRIKKRNDELEGKQNLNIYN
jgi:hypothetical protein